MTMKIPLIKPFINQEVKDSVLQVLDSGMLTEGSVTREFESVFKHYIGCEHAIAVTSCTTGLEIALRAIGIGRHDEVIVPDFTYPATAAAVAIVGAKPVLVDVDPDTMLIDYQALEKAITEKTRAIMPVSIFGNPLDYDRLNAIKSRHHVYIIEDAACSIGAAFRSIKTGNFADISVFSLHPRKFITTGEGGVITTNRADWANWITSYKHFGISAPDNRLNIRFDQIGGNYKMSNILAAVGLAQFRHIKKLMDERLSLADRYHQMLYTAKDVTFPKVTSQGLHSRQSFCIFVKHRDEVMNKMRDLGIEVQIGTYALHMQPAFSKNPKCRIAGQMEGSRFAFNNCLTLPLYHGMTEQEQKLVVQKLTEFLE